VRWVLGYTDARNYVYLELDGRNFKRHELVDGKPQQEKEVAHKQSGQIIHVNVEVRANQIVHQIRSDGNPWSTVDTWQRASQRSLENGSFGFELRGDDEVNISNFKFEPTGEP
jgi:hypothetical protein